jgi:hypothetical protein
MFRVEFFCDDKKLAEALRALMGVAHGAPSVVPVVNAIKTGNGLAAASGGSHVDRFIVGLKGVDAFSGHEARKIAKAQGLNPASSNHFLKNAIARGVIRKAGGKGSHTTYKVV